MIRSIGGCHAIARQPTSVCLQPLLQRGLPVVGERGIGGLIAADVDQRAEARHDEFARRLDAAVQIDRRDQRLEAIGQDRVLATSSGLLLAAPEQDERTQIDLFGQPRQRGRRHDPGLDL
jgi:hypothetical protein